MDYNYTLELFEKLQSELAEESPERDENLEYYSSTIQKVRNEIKELELYVKDNPWIDNTEEILYFKKVYPLFCSRLIYFSERYNLEKGLQLVDQSEWSCYLKEEIKIIPRFFKKNAFLYEYYRLGLSELDHIYFTQNGAKSKLIPEFPAIDFTAAATTSYIFSKIMAFERLRKDLQSKLDALDSPKARNDSKEKLKWTGDVINLVEMAYGIHLTGQMNNGNASLNQIVRWLETNLDVNIGIVQRKFTEIGNRKRLSSTKFIDQMRHSIIQKIQNDIK